MQPQLVVSARQRGEPERRARGVDRLRLHRPVGKLEIDGSVNVRTKQGIDGRHLQVVEKDDDLPHGIGCRHEVLLTPVHDVCSGDLDAENAPIALRHAETVQTGGHAPSLEPDLVKGGERLLGSTGARQGHALDSGRVDRIAVLVEEAERPPVCDMKAKLEHRVSLDRQRASRGEDVVPPLHEVRARGHVGARLHVRDDVVGADRWDRERDGTTTRVTPFCLPSRIGIPSMAGTVRIVISAGVRLRTPVTSLPTSDRLPSNCADGCLASLGQQGAPDAKVSDPVCIHARGPQRGVTQKEADAS